MHRNIKINILICLETQLVHDKDDLGLLFESQESHQAEQTIKQTKSLINPRHYDHYTIIYMRRSVLTHI